MVQINPKRPSENRVFQTASNFARMPFGCVCPIRRSLCKRPEKPRFYATIVR
ncbi:hypothetical protein HMPREF9123_1064 [Neisseria bacilliformis ATCC BAA-1200]|uniref:Uncharacterized protein n=1 Tax=Neisseria bacilliformis ATCC BAA-1200 TaxID=888742 RepID=F2BBF9_9NEIS|nr:hypothetical protein HMPREF9123_1064 [Neisseria bacilliformis ATCC BAA-1200]